jgi:hypothetical protein
MEDSAMRVKNPATGAAAQFNKRTNPWLIV